MTSNSDLSRYDPRLLEAWRQSAHRTVIIKLPSRQAATTLRHRLYKLRSDLRRLNHPLAALANLRMIALSPGKAQPEWELIISPTDTSFDEPLRAAGLEPAIPAPPPLDFNLNGGSMPEDDLLK